VTIYDSAATSIDVERFILQQLEFFKTPREALDFSLPGENVYRISIEVEQVESRELIGDYK
jgi:hypothetical protein